VPLDSIFKRTQRWRLVERSTRSGEAVCSVKRARMRRVDGARPIASSRTESSDDVRPNQPGWSSSLTGRLQQAVVLLPRSASVYRFFLADALTFPSNASERMGALKSEKGLRRCLT
jgi:hypothetical protein